MSEIHFSHGIRTNGLWAKILAAGRLGCPANPPTDVSKLGMT